MRKLFCGNKHKVGLLVIIVFFLMTGCADGGNNSETTDSDSEVENTEVVEKEEVEEKEEEKEQEEEKEEEIQEKNTSIEIDESAETIEKETDVVVVGAGSAGLAAAVSAAEGGANVILLEKMPAVGGTGNFAEGIFAVESDLQRNENVATSRDEAFKIMTEYSHWRGDAKIARAFVDKSANTIDWLEGHGVEFSHLTAINPGGLRTWHIFDGRGAAMSSALEAKAEELGVEILYETTGKKLKMSDENEVAGIIAVDPEERNVNITAPSVVIASGGFANNEDMLAKHTDAENVEPVGSVGKLGEGIQMAWEVGAEERGTDVLQLYRPGVPGEATDSHLSAAARQPHLWINKNGERFCDETVIFEWPFAGNALANQEDGIMYVMFDENTKEYMINDGIDIGVGVMVPVGTKLDELDDALAKGIENNDVIKADSIEELAEALEMDVEILNDEITRYNNAYEKRHDDLFAKDSKYLNPLTEAPFYAIKSKSHFLGTLGGIKINEHAEVIDTDNNVITGLYAAGNDAGGMYGDSYDLTIPGGTIGFAVNYGRIAGENASQYVVGE